ncbi:MAG: DUF3891 family protein [Leeuwenhoekiella sp.]
MIVKQTISGWEIISHYTHGLLAGKLANQLKKDLKNKYWSDVLTAIIEHDDHLLDFEEQNYLTEMGTPLDFTLSSGTNTEVLEHAKRVYADSLQKSQLVALLVGRHLSFLNESLATTYKPMKDFLKDVDHRGKQQRKIYSLTKTQENHLYNILLFCDRCSLILCQDQIPEVGRKLEINHTINKKTYFIAKNDSDLIKIEPWCFEEDSFELHLEYRVLKKASFKSNRELQECLEDAKVQLRVFKFSK